MLFSFWERIDEVGGFRGKWERKKYLGVGAERAREEEDEKAWGGWGNWGAMSRFLQDYSASNIKIILNARATFYRNKEFARTK